MYKSIIFFIALSFWTILYGILCLPVLLLPKGHKSILLVNKIWAKVVLFLLKFFCQVHSNVTGMNNIPLNQPYIIASKHQSAWETIFFLQLLHDPIFIIKKELSNIPIYGLYVKKSMILIDRNNGVKALRHMHSEVKKAIENNRPIIIFPEGTRNGTSYKSGIKFLHDKFDSIPIIPVALNSGKHWNKFSITKGIIQVKILPKFETQDNFLFDLQNIIEKESNTI